MLNLIYIHTIVKNVTLSLAKIHDILSMSFIVCAFLSQLKVAHTNGFYIQIT